MDKADGHQHMVNIKNIVEKSMKEIENLTGKPAVSVVSVDKGKTGWDVLVEIIERKAIPDTQDIIGRYELGLDNNGEVLKYKRIQLRTRGDLSKEVGEEEKIQSA